MADGGTEIERLVTVFDADYSKLDAKLNAVIRAQYGAAQKISDAWKKAATEGKAAEALAQSATLRNIQLENDLSIARARGNKAQITALTEQLLIEQQLSKLKRAGITGDAALGQAKSYVTALSAAERAAAAAKKTGLALAATNIFDATKLSVLEEGGARLRVFGSALEPLGPWGIAAAAGIVALALAGEEARKAMEWAGTLRSTSEALGVSTDSLQKLDYASAAAGIGLEKGRAALGAFNEEIGKFETHTGDTRLKKWADAIKLDRDQVNATVDPVAKLALVMDKIATLKDAQSRTSAAKAFGLGDLLPIINGGAQSIAGFIGKMKEAQGVGGVISPADIQRAAEMNEKVDALGFLIGTHFKSAFLEAAPAIEKVAEFIERATHALSDFLGEIPDAIRGLDDLISKIPHLPQGIHVDVGAAAEGVARAAGLGLGIDTAQAAKGGLDALAARGRAVKLASGVADLMAGKPVDFRGTELGATKGQGKAQQLTFDKAKKGPADQTDALTKTAEEDQQHALKALAEAYKNLTANVDARAKFEVDANNAEAATEQAKLKGDLAHLLKDQTIDGKASDILQAKIEQAQADVELARVAKNDLVERNALRAITDQWFASQKEIAGYLDQVSSAAAENATTAKARTAIERTTLLAQQRLARAILKEALDREVADDPTKASDAAAKLNAFDRAQVAQRQSFDTGHEDPVQRYIRSVQDLNTVMQNAAVTAAVDLSNGLADAIVNAKNLGDVAKNVFRKIATDLLAAVIQKDIAAPVLAFLGLADGGRVSGPGTSTSDSIPAMLSSGEFVVNAAATSKHGKLLEAINSGQMPHLAAGGLVPSISSSFDALRAISLPARSPSVVVVQPFHFHAEGAVLTQEILGQANAHADRSAARAGQWARGMAAQDSSKAAYASQLNQ